MEGREKGRDEVTAPLLTWEAGCSAEEVCTFFLLRTRYGPQKKVAVVFNVAIKIVLDSKITWWSL